MRREEEPASLLVCEQLDLLGHQASSSIQIGWFIRCPIQPDQSIGQESIVIEITIQFCFTACIGPQQPTIRSAQLLQNKNRGTLSRSDVSWFLEQASRIGQAANHEAVIS